MRLILCCVILFAFLEPIAAQSQWFNIDTNQLSADKDFHQVINIVNEETNALITVFKYRGFIVAYLNNSEGDLISTFRTEVVPKFRDNYFGASINDDDYTLFFQNEYGTKFSALTINFKTSSFEYNNKLKIPLKAQTLIGSFEYESHIYFLTSVQKSSELKLYRLHNHNNFSVKTFDFSDVNFVSKSGFKISLNWLLDGGYKSSKASLINNKEPSSLELASKKNKLYLNGNNLILTCDFYDSATNVLSINLKDETTKHTKFIKPSFDKKDRGSKSNSYVYQNYFFTIYASKEKLDFTIYNLETEALIKSFLINEEDTITFKNSPIILEGGGFQEYRELDKTKQFLRKVSNSNAGLFIYKNGDKFIATLGSSENSTVGVSFFFFGGALGGFMYGITTSILTPSFFAYTKTKSTRIECLLDENFNNLPGEIPENNFDKIQTYIDTKIDSKIKYKSIFKINNKYVLGYFEEEKGIYKYVVTNK